MVMTKSCKVVLAIGLAYCAGIAALYVIGKDGFAAGMLALPGSFIIGYLVYWVPPKSALQVVADSWTGNLIELVLSAALNVAGVYLVVRLLSRAPKM
jgi:hypothetical protein